VVESKRDGGKEENEEEVEKEGVVLVSRK